MKKYITVALTVLLLLCFTGCVNNNVNVSTGAIKSTTHEFILTPAACKSLFSCNPNEVRNSLKESPWVKGNFISAAENQDGNLRLVLSDSNINHWKTAIENKMENYQELRKIDGLRFEINESYTSLTYYTTKELSLASGTTMTEIVVYCGIMQMLNGDDPNTWYVDLAMADVETGKIVGQGRIPDGELNVDDSQ